MQAVHRIRLGLANAYLIQGERNSILVDAGISHCRRIFLRHLRKRGIERGTIRLIVITHVHFDHAGSLGEIKRLCRCPAAVHENEASLLRRGTIVFPPGTNLFGKAVSFLGRHLANRLPAFGPVEPEIICSTEMALNPFGVRGKIMPTPGHTSGSLSVLLATGEAFVGDLAANYLPMNLGPIFPPFAEDVTQLFQSWQKLLDAGAKRIYPAHGSPFGADLLIRRLRSCPSGA